MGKSLHNIDKYSIMRSLKKCAYLAIKVDLHHRVVGQLPM